MGIILEIHEDDVVTSVSILTSSVELVNTVGPSIELVNTNPASIILEVTTGPQGPPGGGEGGGVTDGDKGDITVTSTGTVWTIDPNSVSYAKIQNISSENIFLGRISPGAGDIEELTPSNAKTILALTKSDVGLSNVDNTSDVNKPVSSATQTALNAKQDLDSDLTDIAALSPTNDDVIQRKAGQWTNRTPSELKADLSLTKSDVGLSNVDNTSDANKPVSTATQTALDAKQPLDSDLTAIAALAPANDLIIQRKAGAWTARTMSELKTDLVIVVSDISDFDTEVSNNTDVAANTAARHTHANSAILAATTASFLTADETKLDGIEAGADVTDADNVNAAGAVMNTDITTEDMFFVLDEDDMGSNSATHVPTQQSVKAYVDAASGGIPNGDKGDITVSDLGATWIIDADAVTYSKIQNVTATSRILGRITSGAGDIEELTAADVKTILALTKSDVGLGNVDNTSDINKPVSSATQTALDGKQNLDSDLTAIAGLSPTNDDIIQRKSGAWTNRTMGQLKTDLVLVKADVGLGNVDNTSDANKPVSTATQTALDLKANDNAVVHLSGSETITGVKSFTTPKTQSAYIITRALGAGDDVTSTDEDIFKVLFGADAATPVRSFWINEWGALRIDVPATHGSEAAIKIAPGTSAGGYVLAVGTSADINDLQFWIKNDGSTQIGDLVATDIIAATVDLSSTLVVDGLATFNSTVDVNGDLTPKRFLNTPVALTDAATIAVDASLGNLFRVTLGGNRTLGNPSNSVDGQLIMFEIKQDGTGSRTLSLGSAYNFGTDLTSITLSTAINITDRLLCQYVSARSEWDVIGFKKGF